MNAADAFSDRSRAKLRFASFRHGSSAIKRHNRETRAISSEERCIKQNLTIKWISFRKHTHMHTWRDTGLPSTEVQKAQTKAGMWEFVSKILARSVSIGRRKNRPIEDECTVDRSINMIPPNRLSWCECIVYSQGDGTFEMNTGEVVSYRHGAVDYDSHFGKHCATRERKGKCWNSKNTNNASPSRFPFERILNFRSRVDRSPPRYIDFPLCYAGARFYIELRNLLQRDSLWRL